MRISYVLFIATVCVVAQPVLNTVQVTHNGKVHGGAAISPDGKQLAWIEDDGPLVVRDIATATERKFPFQESIPQPRYSPVFSPDGKSVWFRARTSQNRGEWGLYEYPLSGGMPMLRTADVDRRAAFAPDGKSIAFIRFIPRNGTRLLLAPVAGKSGPAGRASAKSGAGAKIEPRELYSWPDGIRVNALAFSPDGNEIAVVVHQKGYKVQFIGVKKQAFREMDTPALLGTVAWSSSALFGVMRENQENPGPQQVWRFPLPNGPWTKVTNDDGGFSPDILSASADGSLLAAERYVKLKTGLEGIAEWLGDKGGGPRVDPNVVLIRPAIKP